ncbi:hypothetical protein Drorol1_Dr00003390 [Drosera rotundifolia]
MGHLYTLIFTVHPGCDVFTPSSSPLLISHFTASFPFRHFNFKTNSKTISPRAPHFSFPCCSSSHFPNLMSAAKRVHFDLAPSTQADRGDGAVDSMGSVSHVANPLEVAKVSAQPQNRYSEPDNRDWRGRSAQAPVAGEERSWDSLHENRELIGRLQESNQGNQQDHLTSQFSRAQISPNLGYYLIARDQAPSSSIMVPVVVELWFGVLIVCLLCVWSRILEIEEPVWVGIEETAGVSPATHHVGAATGCESFGNCGEVVEGLQIGISSFPCFTMNLLRGEYVISLVWGFPEMAKKMVYVSQGVGFMKVSVRCVTRGVVVKGVQGIGPSSLCLEDVLFSFENQGFK